MMPPCDQTGVPIHFHSSTTSGSASLMSLRILLRVSPRQSPSSAILFEMSSEADWPWLAPETLACADAPCAGTGRSRDRPLGTRRRSASGRRGAVADDARSREVRLCHSSWEADEQSGPDRSGAGGAKGGGQGERAPAKHAPDTGTGARGTSAGARTASRKATEEGEVHCTPPPHQHRLPADGVLRAQTRCRLRGGWTDVADLRSRP